MTITECFIFVRRKWIFIFSYRTHFYFQKVISKLLNICFFLCSSLNFLVLLMFF